MNKTLDGIKIIAIDLIGTLIKSGKDKIFEEILKSLDKRKLEYDNNKLYSLFNLRYIEYSMGNYKNDYYFYKFILPEYSHSIINEIVSGINKKLVEFYPKYSDAHIFLKKSCKKYKLILCSNFIYDWALEIIRFNKWEKYFSDFLISSKVRYRKPSVYFFSELFKNNKQSLSSIVFIGDSIPNDIFGAMNVGLKIIHLSRHKNYFSLNLLCATNLNDAFKLLN